MEENKKLIFWIAGGILLGVIVIFFAVTSGSKLSGGPKSASEVGPVATTTAQGIVAAPGLSPVSNEGKVVTRTGKAVELDVKPGSPDAPQQSNTIAPENLPKASIKLSMSAAGISPSAFTVKRGTAVTLAVTAIDNQTHVFLFDDPSLSAVAIGVGPDETRAITFNAPGKGEYKFHCDVPGHALRGEVGVMKVE